MTAPSQSLYESLGAEVGIRNVVDDFYRRVTADPELGSYFSGADLPTLRRHQVAMLSAATGGPSRYTGRDMTAAHAGLRISDAHFDRVVAHLVDSLAYFGTTPDVIERVGEVLLPLRPAIVGK